jgi:adenosylmethionine-8-amino-7-oxononanoate aminotransferase
MTGFGRTGRWFGMEHWGVRPDILVGAKGGTSGYVPFGLVAASGHVHETVVGEPPGFVHGFTYSHHAVGTAAAAEVLRILEDEGLVEASAAKGERLQALLRDRLGGHPNVGEIRGRGLLLGVELVADRETRAPFPRADRVTENVLRAARERGLLLYSGTGMADGTNGDAIVLGPPFVITDGEMELLAEGLAGALDAVVATVPAA